MTNEAITYQDFVQRCDDELPNLVEGDDRENVLARAWDECAWISTLTKERLRQALENARREG